MALVGMPGPVLGKRNHGHISQNRQPVSKRRKQSPNVLEAIEPEIADAGSDFDPSDVDTDPSLSTPPTPRSVAASQSAEPSSRPLKYKCTYDGCDKAFSRPVRLEEHIRAHNNERLFKCPYGSCEKDFLRQSHLNHHIKSAHTGERDYVCDWEGCDMKFATGTRLKRHREAHEKRDRFRCTDFPPCDQTFRKHATLQRHIDTEHLELKPYPCKHNDETTGVLCTAAFDTASGLRSHEARCHGGKQYWCSICGTNDGDNRNVTIDSSGFATFAELQTHIKIEHPPKCDYCDLVCSTVGELQRHLDIYHSGTTLDDRRTFICPAPDCGKGFTKQGNLNIHIRSTHEKKKPFVCGETDLSQSTGLQGWDGTNACKRGFTAKASLETHVRKFHLDGSRTLKHAAPATKRGRVTDLKTYRKAPSAAARLTGSGYAEESGRSLSCPIPSCEHRFKRHADLRNHARAFHNLHDAETAEALAEREALSGGRFWLGGIDDAQYDYHHDDDDDADEEDWREITGFDVPAVNVGTGFTLPTGEEKHVEGGQSSVRDEHHLAGLLASCLKDDVVDPALLGAQ